MFAAASVAAVAQDKAPEKGTKAKTSQKAKAGDKAKPAKAKTAKKTQKKGEDTKKVK
jgi:hypothetical protein